MLEVRDSLSPTGRMQARQGPLEGVIASGENQGELTGVSFLGPLMVLWAASPEANASNTTGSSEYARVATSTSLRFPLAQSLSTLCSPSRLPGYRA